MVIALAIVTAVLLSVAWLGNRNWSALLGSAGAGCAGLCIPVLGMVAAGGVLWYAAQIDPHFMVSPARELFWLAGGIVALSVIWGFVLISMDSGNVR